MKPRIVSLCSGYGGLDRAAEQVFDAETIAHCEWAEAPSKVLAHRWPGVPNLHDVTTADWSSINADILTAGYPCQPFSAAGHRKGTDDERHLWPHVAEAVRRVRPRLVLLENVAGHRSLGFGDVLADLASMRYVGSWVSLRASDVGACHGRERVFILAADTAHVGHLRGRVAWDGRDGSPNRRGDATDTERARRAGVDAGTGGEAARSGRERLAGRGAGRPSTADATGVGREAWRTEPARLVGGPDAAERGSSDRWLRETNWGKYEPAIRRHERILGRLAPHPSELAPKGGQRLAPRFVEWMQMLDEGWVTDVPDISRDDQLTILGNGVVVQQAAEATRRMLRNAASAAA